MYVPAPPPRGRIGTPQTVCCFCSVVFCSRTSIMNRERNGETIRYCITSSIVQMGEEQTHGGHRGGSGLLANGSGGGHV